MKISCIIHFYRAIDILLLLYTSIHSHILYKSIIYPLYTTIYIERLCTLYYYVQLLNANPLCIRYKYFLWPTYLTEALFNLFLPSLIFLNFSIYIYLFKPFNMTQGITTPSTLNIMCNDARDTGMNRFSQVKSELCALCHCSAIFFLVCSWIWHWFLSLFIMWRSCRHS